MLDDAVTKDPKIKLWLSNYTGKPNTINLYASSIREYIKFTGKSATQLIKEAKEDIRYGLFMDERRIFEELTLFNASLIEKNAAPKTKAARLASVRSFFSCYYIDVPKLRNVGNAKPLEKNAAIPTKKDLRDGLKVADPLQKAVLLTGASSGLGANEIRNLKINEYKNGLDKDGICTLILRRGKTSVDFVTYLSPECTAAIEDYLTYRDRSLKTNDPRRERQLAKQRVTSNEGYLFVMQNISDKYLETLDEDLRKHTKDSFSKIYESLSMKAGKSAKLGERNILRSHNVRRWFFSTLINSGCDSQAVETWMGHSLGNVKEAYLRLDPQKQKELYKRYMAFLKIQSVLDISETPDFKNVVDERDKYKALAEKYFIDGLELINTRAELNKLKSEKMTPDEKKAAFMDWLNKPAKDEGTARLQAEVKKALEADQ